MRETKGQHSAASFDYDDDGNLTDDGRYTYTWDGENRLIALERKQPRADGDKRLTFQYDYLGRRVRKQVFAWATDHWQLATDESFIYNGWEVIEVVNALAGATGELLTQYTWGLDLSGGLQGAGGIGGLLACEWPQTVGESKKYWFFYDANGNVGQFLRYRTAGGDSITPAARYEYDPYGNTLAAVDMDAQSDPGAAAANPSRFSTKWLDHEPATTNPAGAVGTTGLYYYGYRYYSPALGRWISRDPIGEEGGSNLLQFVGNEPISRHDILGAYWLIGHCGPCIVAGPTILEQQGPSLMAVSYTNVTLPLPAVAGVLAEVVQPEIKSWVPVPEKSMYGRYPNLRAGITCCKQWEITTTCRACCAWPWGGGFTKAGNKTKFLGYTLGWLYWSWGSLVCGAPTPSAAGRHACTDQPCW